MIGKKSKSAAAVQLYTVRSLLEADFEGTIARIAAIGYQEVEAHSLCGRPPAEIRKILDNEGLAMPARHVGLSDLRTRIDEVSEESQTLGCEWVVCPYIDAAERSMDGYRKAADDLNAAAAVLALANLKLAYHNHDFEFSPVDDVIPYDLLLERCDDRLVAMEIDLFWITKGGANPLEYFNRYSGRFPLCHVKDMTRGGSMTEVGKGIIDFATIFAASAQAGLQHYFVEHDDPGDPLASITASCEGLTKLI